MYVQHNPTISLPHPMLCCHAMLDAQPKLHSLLGKIKIMWVYPLKWIIQKINATNVSDHPNSSTAHNSKCVFDATQTAKDIGDK